MQVAGESGAGRYAAGGRRGGCCGPKWLGELVDVFRRGLVGGGGPAGAGGAGDAQV